MIGVAGETDREHGAAVGREAGSRGLRLRLMGGFAAWVDGEPVDPGPWRRRKVSRIVKLLALAPEHRLHRDQVEFLLWPRLAPQAASQNLHHTLYRARHTLEPALERRAEPRFLRLRNDLLELAPDDPVRVRPPMLPARRRGPRSRLVTAPCTRTRSRSSAASCCRRSASRTGRSTAGTR